MVKLALIVYCYKCQSLYFPHKLEYNESTRMTAQNVNCRNDSAGINQ